MTPDQHVLRGTFKPHRHTAQIPPGPVWDPVPAQLEALDAAGRAFIARLQAAYALSPVEGEIALEAAHVMDRLAEVRARRRRASAKLRAELDRLELAWQRAVSGALLALRPARLVAAAVEPKRKWGNV